MTHIVTYEVDVAHRGNRRELCGGYWATHLWLFDYHLALRWRTVPGHWVIGNASAWYVAVAL